MFQDDGRLLQVGHGALGRVVQSARVAVQLAVSVQLSHVRQPPSVRAQLHVRQRRYRSYNADVAGRADRATPAAPGLRRRHLLAEQHRRRYRLQELPPAVAPHGQHHHADQQDHAGTAETDEGTTDTQTDERVYGLGQSREEEAGGRKSRSPQR